MSAKASTKLLAGAVASHQGAAAATQSAATMEEETLDLESVAMAMTSSVQSWRKVPDELIVDDSGLHARTARATINQRALAPREKIQRGVCQNRSTHSLRDGQGHDIKQTTPRTT